MQPNADPILILVESRNVLSVESSASQRSRIKPQLIISPEGREFLSRLRPELALAFELFGSQSRITIASLLQPASHPPLEQFVQSSGFELPASINSEPETRNPELSLALGDLLAAVLHRLRVDAIVGLLQRRGWLRGCQCAARQARLNALTPRLRSLVEPLPQTLVLIFAWLLFAVTLLMR